MKIGFCMFLWTTHVTAKHKALLEDIKATGYDGVEIPIFEGQPDDYRVLARCSTGSAWNARRSQRWAIRP